MEKDFARFEGTKYTVEADIEMCTMVLHIQAWILKWKQNNQSWPLTIRTLH
jgi:hypothetical protein